jgi:hypothetical protein
MRRPRREDRGGGGPFARSLTVAVITLVVGLTCMGSLASCGSDEPEREGVSERPGAMETTSGVTEPEDDREMRHAVTYFVGSRFVSHGPGGPTDLFVSSADPAEAWTVGWPSGSILYRVKDPEDVGGALRLSDSTGRDDRVVARVVPGPALIQACAGGILAYRPAVDPDPSGPPYTATDMVVADVTDGHKETYGRVETAILSEDGRRMALVVLGERDPVSGEFASTVRVVESDGTVHDLMEVDAEHSARLHAIDEERLVFSVTLHSGDTDGRIYVHASGGIAPREACSPGTVLAADPASGWIAVERSGTDDAGGGHSIVELCSLEGADRVRLFTLTPEEGPEGFWGPAVGDVRVTADGRRLLVCLPRLGEGDSLHVFDTATGEELHSHVFDRGVALGPGRIAVSADGDGVALVTQSGEPGAPGVAAEQIRYVDLAAARETILFEREHSAGADAFGVVGIQSCAGGG